MPTAIGSRSCTSSAADKYSRPLLAPRASIFKNIFVATSVHIPQELLEAVDRRARTLKVSRNKLIVQALEREIRTSEADWPDGFFERLEGASPSLVDTVNEMEDAILAARRSKGPPNL